MKIPRVFVIERFKDDGRWVASGVALSTLSEARLDLEYTRNRFPATADRFRVAEYRRVAVAGENKLNKTIASLSNS